MKNGMRLINGLSKREYDELVSTCDIGLIFLEHRFTVPNFPSRLLSYMENVVPVFACTDRNTYAGRIIENGNYGWWCKSNDENPLLWDITVKPACDIKTLTDVAVIVMNPRQ